MKRFHVTYYYLATGMEGHADERDYGMVDAATADEAKTKVADHQCKGDSDTRSFFIGCLRAEEVPSQIGYDKAMAAIKAGRAQAHALWAMLNTENDRKEFGLKPDPWEGPGEYQRVSLSAEDLGWFVRIPDGKSLPTPGKLTPKVETAKDPNGNWYVMVDGKMDTDIPYSRTEEQAAAHASANYPRAETIFTTDHPDHYSNRTTQAGTVDMTPTWGEIGIIACRLAQSGEMRSLRRAWPEVAKAFAMAEAAKALKSRMSPELQQEFNDLMRHELRKQENACPTWAKDQK